MAQVFNRGRVLALKLGSLIAAALVVTVVLAWRWSIDYAQPLRAPVQQPLPFSHEHHVGDDGIDCRYCHSTVESSSFAGMPSSEVCMTCHSQLFRDVPLFAPLHASVRTGKRLQWTRVNDLPDFVYFDHSAHVSHGVPCQDCHGRIDKMPLTARVQSLEMQWCLSCHRDPAPNLVSSQEVFSMKARPPPSTRERLASSAHYDLLTQRWLTDCSTCHR